MSGSTNIMLPAIPAPSTGSLAAIFVKGIRNNGAAATVPQYVTFGHAFQKGQLPARSGVTADFGSGSVPCQVDVKTSYPADGSAAHAIISVAAPAVAAGVTTWGQFSVATAPEGNALSLASALVGVTASATLTPTALADWSSSIVGLVVNANTATTTPPTMIQPKTGNAGNYIFLATATRSGWIWQASHAYTAGSVITPSVGNGGEYNFVPTAGTTGATQPTWPQTVGATVSDGSVTWTNVGVPGTAGDTEPTWPQTLGATVVDNNVTWTCTSQAVPIAPIDLVALVKNATADPWLSGPLAVQGRASQNVSQGLRLVVDATAYVDGTVNFDVDFANDTLPSTVAVPNVGNVWTLAYSAELTLNSKPVFTSAPLWQFLYTNWSWQFGTVPHITNSSQENVLQIVHDPEDFITAQALQAYDSSLGVSENNYTGAQRVLAAPGFGQPMINPGGFTSQYMPGVGGRPDIGIDDIYACWWFVTQDPAFYSVAMELSKVGGSVPWHYFNPSTQRYWTVDDDPTLYVWPGFGGMPYNHTIPVYGSGIGYWAVDPAHFPELNYIQYLVTGRRYLLDELNAVTAWTELIQLPNHDRSNQGGRWGGRGIILDQDQIRGCAWSLRNINYAVYANPDGSAFKEYFRRMLDNNLYWFLGQIQHYQAIQGNEIFGYFPTWAYPGGMMPNFEECYFTSSITFSALLGHPAAMQICQWMNNYFSGRLLNGTNQPITGLPPCQATTYDLFLFAMPKGNTQPYWWSQSFTPPLQTWDAMEAELVDVQDAADSCVQDGKVVWAPGNLGSGGSYADYSQLTYISQTCFANVGVVNALEARDAFTSQVADDGTSPPTLDDASWANANQTWRNVARPMNDSQVIALPAAPQAYASVMLPSLGAAGGAVAHQAPPAQQAISGSGEVVVPGVEASGSAAVPGYAALANALSAVKAALDTL